MKIAYVIYNIVLTSRKLKKLITHNVFITALITRYVLADLLRLVLNVASCTQALARYIFFPFIKGVNNSRRLLLYPVTCVELSQQFV